MINNCYKVTLFIFFAFLGTKLMLGAFDSLIFSGGGESSFFEYRAFLVLDMIIVAKHC